jgi:DNA mismatch endonuclease (patch repair protein)
MSRIRSKDTKPEMIIRRGLHVRGLRYRLHRRDLPGTPDLVFARQRVVVFVHGCFWHGHGCHLCKEPTTRTDFWTTKLTANVTRDNRALDRLHATGWRTLVVWECSLRGRQAFPVDDVIRVCQDFISNQSYSHSEIAGLEEGAV